MTSINLKGPMVSPTQWGMFLWNETNHTQGLFLNVENASLIERYLDKTPSCESVATEARQRTSLCVLLGSAAVPWPFSNLPTCADLSLRSRIHRCILEPFKKGVLLLLVQFGTVLGRATGYRWHVWYDICPWLLSMSWSATTMKINCNINSVTF